MLTFMYEQDGGPLPIAAPTLPPVAKKDDVMLESSGSNAESTDEVPAAAAPSETCPGCPASNMNTMCPPCLSKALNSSVEWVQQGIAQGRRAEKGSGAEKGRGAEKGGGAEEGNGAEAGSGDAPRPVLGDLLLNWTLSSLSHFFVACLVSL